MIQNGCLILILRRLRLTSREVGSHRERHGELQSVYRRPTACFSALSRLERTRERKLFVAAKKARSPCADAHALSSAGAFTRTDHANASTTASMAAQTASDSPMLFIRFDPGAQIASTVDESAASAEASACTER